MPLTRFQRFLPIAGILAAILFALTQALSFDVPSVGDGTSKLFSYLAAHQTALDLAGVAAGYFCVLMVMFGAGLRAALRSGEAGESSYSAVAFAGALVVAGSIAASGVLLLAGVEAADKGHQEVVSTIGFISDFTWIPWAAGAGAMLIATGLGGLRTLALPKWLAIATLLLGVLSLTGPTGIGVYIAMPLWLLVTGVVLVRRQAPRGAERTAPQPAAPAAALGEAT